MSAQSEVKGSQKIIKRAPQTKTIRKSDGECVDLNLPLMPEFIFVQSTIVTKNSYAASNIEEGCCTLDLSGRPDKNRNVPQIVKPTQMSSPTIHIQRQNQTVTLKRTQTIGENSPHLGYKLHNATESYTSASNKNSPKITISSKPKSTLSTNQNTESPLYRQKVDASTFTESPNPMRDRSIQTDVSPETITVGIQCDISDGFSDEEVFEASTATNSDIRAEFLKFFNKNIHIYSEFNYECTICGEIQRQRKEMEKHVALHWGPSALCFSCGLYLEHESLLQRHNCSENDTKLKRLEQFKRTPFAFKSYAPLKAFTVTKATGKLIPPLFSGTLKRRSLLKTRRKLMTCVFCEKKCRNAQRYRNHNKKCLKKYKQSLKNIRLKINRRIQNKAK